MTRKPYAPDIGDRDMPKFKTCQIVCNPRRNESDIAGVGSAETLSNLNMWKPTAIRHPVTQPHMEVMQEVIGCRVYGFQPSAEDVINGDAAT